MDTSADAYFPDPRPLTPGQRRQLWARLAIRLGIFLSLVLFLCLAGRPLLSLCMPFALALLATWLTEPLLRFFHRRWNIPRGIGAIVLILLLVGALGGLMAALIWKGWSELSTLWGNWDQGWNAFQETYYQLSHALDKWLAYLPQQVQDTLWNLSDRLLAWLEEFVYNLLPKTTSAVRSISSFVLAFLFFLVAWYFTAEDYPNLRRVARETIPRSVRRIGVQARGAFSAAFGGYLKAEILVSLGVTGILLVGFFPVSYTHLYIVEGDSAGGSATQGRDSRFQAILPLWGKMLNVEKARADRVYGNDKLSPVITALGAGIGEEFNPEKLRYHKIVIMADADVDGAHIRTLLLTFFFRFMRPLIEQGYVYSAVPPLYKLTRGKQQRVAYSDEERDAVSAQMRGDNPNAKVEISHFKGLGEMDPHELWETTMNPETRTLRRITLEDAVKADEIFTILMGEKVEPRKEFIEENAKYVVNLDI